MGSETRLWTVTYKLVFEDHQSIVRVKDVAGCDSYEARDIFWATWHVGVRYNCRIIAIYVQTVEERV